MNIRPHLRVTVVSGPPCSGKSTYVAKHRGTGDLILEMDRLTQALGADGHDQSSLRHIFACEAMDAIVRKLIWTGYAGRIWYVACRPGHDRLLQFGASVEHVKLTAPIDVLKARAAAERPPRWIDLIDRHFGNPVKGNAHGPRIEWLD